MYRSDPGHRHVGVDGARHRQGSRFDQADRRQPLLLGERSCREDDAKKKDEWRAQRRPLFTTKHTKGGALFVWFVGCARG
jgi:hypothetical protein